MLSLEPFTEDQVGRRCNPQGDPTNQLPCALRVYSPVDSHTCQTPWSVFQDGPNGEPTGRRQERAGAEARQGRALPSTIAMMTSPRAYQQPGLGPPSQSASVNVRVDRRTGSHRSTSDRDTSPAPIRFPPDNFKHSLTLFQSPFHLPSRYLFAIGLSPVFSLGRNLPPIGAAFPNNPTRRQRSWCDRVRARRGSHPLWRPLQGTWARSATETLLQTTIRTPRATDFHGGLFPVRSPLLRESLQACPRPNGFGRNCVQRLDGSRDSAIHTKYRISLRSSSMQEPRYPCRESLYVNVVS
uniref:Uncharacterized protein n=1 Tax=Glycine max TaxID=3847 RepID=A0A0R0GH10_SOYBN